MSGRRVAGAKRLRKRRTRSGMDDVALETARLSCVRLKMNVNGLSKFYIHSASTRILANK